MSSVREVPFDDELARGIWEIYNESPIRQGRIFPHYGKSFEAVREMSATFLDSSVFIGAFEGNKLIGFIKLTIDDSRTQAGIMHIISMLAHRDKAPTNALVAQAVRSCADRNIPQSCLREIRLREKGTEQSERFQGAKWVPTR